MNLTVAMNYERFIDGEVEEVVLDGVTYCRAVVDGEKLGIKYVTDGEYIYSSEDKKEYIKDASYKKCPDCGKFYEVDTLIAVYGGSGVRVAKRVCHKCIAENYKACNDCGRFFCEVTPTDMRNHYCASCLPENTFKCDDCGKYIEGEKPKVVNGKHFCQSCFEEKYVYCEVCGKRILRSKAKRISGVYYCQSCSEQVVRVEGYSYKPSPKFHGSPSNNRFFGIEVETEGMESNLLANEIVGADKVFYAKHDGSLNDGIEFVSHPCSLDFWNTTDVLKGFCSRAVANGFKSHNTDSCGLHVHVSRESVKRETFEKVLLLINNNWSNVVKFTRRDSSRINRWAANNLSEYRLVDKSVEDKVKLVKEYRSDSRYVALNTTRSTYEFRIFRGSLKPTTIKASIQFCDIVLEYCAQNSFSTVDKATFSSLITFAKANGERYADFVAYCQEKHLG